MRKYKIGEIIKTKTPGLEAFEIKSIIVKDDGIWYCTNERPPTFSIHESNVLGLYMGKGNVTIIKIEEVEKIYN
jgi:hypothetical protein